MARKYLKLGNTIIGLSLMITSAYTASLSGLQEGYCIANLTNAANNLAAAALQPSTMDITDLDGATLGTLAFSNQKYFKIGSAGSNSGYLLAFARNSSTSWMTLKSSVVVPTTTSESPLTINLNSVVTNTGTIGAGVSSVASIVFTRSTGSTTLSRSQILSFLSNINFSGVASNILPLNLTASVVPTGSLAVTSFYTATATFFTSTSGLPVGWSAKIFSGAGPLATHLMPMSVTLTLPVTPLGGTASNYTVTIPDLSAYNLANADTTSTQINFQGSTTGFDLLFDVNGGEFNKATTTGITDQIAAILTSGTRITPSTGSVGSSMLPRAVDYVRKLVHTGDTADSTAAADAKSIQGWLSTHFGLLMLKNSITASSAAADTAGGGVTRLTANAASSGYASTTGAYPRMICFGLTPENSGFSYDSSVADTTAKTVSVVARFAQTLNSTANLNPVTQTFTSDVLTGTSLDVGSVIGFTASSGDYFVVKVTDYSDETNCFVTSTLASAAYTDVAAAQVAANTTIKPAFIADKFPVASSHAYATDNGTIGTNGSSKLGFMGIVASTGNGYAFSSASFDTDSSVLTLIVRLATSATDFGTATGSPITLTGKITTFSTGDIYSLSNGTEGGNVVFIRNLNGLTVTSGALVASTLTSGLGSKCILGKTSAEFQVIGIASTTAASTANSTASALTSAMTTFVATPSSGNAAAAATAVSNAVTHTTAMLTDVTTLQTALLSAQALANTAVTACGGPGSLAYTGANAMRTAINTAVSSVATAVSNATTASSYMNIAAGAVAAANTVGGYSDNTAPTVAQTYTAIAVTAVDAAKTSIDTAYSNAILATIAAAKAGSNALTDKTAAADASTAANNTTLLNAILTSQLASKSVLGITLPQLEAKLS